MTAWVAEWCAPTRLGHLAVREGSIDILGSQRVRPPTDPRLSGMIESNDYGPSNHHGSSEGTPLGLQDVVPDMVVFVLVSARSSLHTHEIWTFPARPEPCPPGGRSMLAGSTSRTPEEPTGSEHKARWLMPGFFPTTSRISLSRCDAIPHLAGRTRTHARLAKTALGTSSVHLRSHCSAKRAPEMVRTHESGPAACAHASSHLSARGTAETWLRKVHVEEP